MAFHGRSSSRPIPGCLFPPGLLTAAGVRMIGVDRPGYGLSRWTGRRNLRTGPRSRRACRPAGHRRFAVLEHSPGSAYALAYGPALGDPLAVIVIASGMGPVLPGERVRSGTGPMTCTGGWPAVRPVGCWPGSPIVGLAEDARDDHG